MGGLRLVADAPGARRRARAAAALACLAVACALAGSARAASAPPRADARAWLVENPADGAIVDQHDVQAEMPIASITKLMTVIVSLEHLRLDQIVRVDPRAAAAPPESIYLTPGEEISVHDLVEGALIQSANDAADALALATAPSFPAFAKLMNAKAAQLGLCHTHFVRPDGLDAPGEYSSAHDVTLLAQAAMRIPIVRATVDRRTATIAGGQRLTTWNDLLGVFPGVFGVKTGNTSQAGWCQVLAARDDGTTIYVTILGSPSEARRNADLERLLVYGLSQFREVDAVSAHLAYAEVGLPYGRGPLPLVAAAPLALDVRLGTPLVERVVAPLSLGLPVRAGESVGRIEVFAAGRLLGARALVAARPAAAAGIATRVGWYAGRMVHDLVGLLP